MLIRSITLFNFSKIKSESIFQMAEYNSFNYDFNKTEPYYDRNNDIITFKKDTIQHYIKKVNVTLPSCEYLKKVILGKIFSIIMTLLLLIFAE